MVKKLIIFVLAGSFLFAVVANKSIPQEILNENQNGYVEMYRLKLHNIKNGAIEVSSDSGLNWSKIGEVIYPIKQTNDSGFTASKWGKSGTVVASAVNALHIKTGHNRTKDRGVLFSILPSSKLYQTKYNSYFNKTSSIFTDICGGTSIFGGKWSIFVGNLVYLEDGEKLIPLPYLYKPQIGDKLVIIVRRPDPYPVAMIFENRAGGLIYLQYFNGQKKAIGQVAKPVQGVGRFLGTYYSDVGRVRANHTGVIDISTSPMGKIGGFQIIPAKHSESPEMAIAKIRTQWMIVAPLHGLSAGNEGLSPLFSDYITPRYVEEDMYKDDWIKRVAQRTLVSVKYKNKDGWQPMPIYHADPKMPLPEKFNSVLKDVEKIRILFPIFKN